MAVRGKVETEKPPQTKKRAGLVPLSLWRIESRVFRPGRKGEDILKDETGKQFYPR
jgi:hypothetical protein